MSREPQHRADHSARAIHEMFLEPVHKLGMGYADEEIELAMMRIPIDGTPLGQIRPEFRRPHSNFYATRYLEARATARMLVELGAADGVANLQRGDSPDVTVLYEDRHRLYVEQAMILDDAAHRLSLAVEDANAAIPERVKGSPAALRAFENGLLTIRLNRLDLAVPFDSSAIADEIVTILDGLTERVELMKPDPLRQPLLYTMSAHIFYRPGSLKGGPIYAPAFHGRLAVFESTFARVLKKKVGKAGAYGKAPLWLLLCVDTHFDNPYHVKRVVQDILSEADLGVFERAVVQVPRLGSLVVENGAE